MKYFFMLFMPCFLFINFLNHSNASISNTTTSTTEKDISKNITNLNLIKALNKTNTNETEIGSISNGSKSNNLKQISNLLRKEQAERCEYEGNPKLDEICPSVRSKPSFSKYMNTITLSQIEDAIINKTIVEQLREKCRIGEWCLEDHFIFNNYFAHNTELFCMFSDCYDEIKIYIEKCVGSRVTRDILSIAPFLCATSSANNYKLNTTYCIENSLELIHVSIASLANYESAHLHNVNVSEILSLRMIY